MAGGRRIPGLLVLGGLALSACGSEPAPPLVASNIEISAPMPGRSMSAAYLDLTNNSGETITIDRVSSPQFEAVEIHESTLENGIARMRPLTALPIPPGASVHLERGGKHLMLMRPTGQSEQVELNFMSGDTILMGVTSRITQRKP